jgi:hypothetical protein
VGLADGIGCFDNSEIVYTEDYGSSYDSLAVFADGTI